MLEEDRVAKLLTHIAVEVVASPGAAKINTGEPRARRSPLSEIKSRPCRNRAARAVQITVAIKHPKVAAESKAG